MGCCGTCILCKECSPLSAPADISPAKFLQNTGHLFVEDAKNLYCDVKK